METPEYWAEPNKDGNINVPDELDDLVNKIAIQLRFHTISGKNEIMAICDAAYNAQKFFAEYYQPKIDKLNEFNSKLIEIAKEALTDECILGFTDDKFCDERLKCKMCLDK